MKYVTRYGEERGWEGGHEKVRYVTRPEGEKGGGGGWRHQKVRYKARGRDVRK